MFNSNNIFNTASKFNLSNILGGLDKTLGVINKAIPLYEEAKPLFNNAKSLFSDISKNIKTDHQEKPVINTQKKEINNDNSPIFFQ